MSEIWTMGEILVEIMRPRAGMELSVPGEFLGPYPSGAPAIFIDTAARLNHSASIIGSVGEDDFGKCLLDRLAKDGVDCRYVKSIPGVSTGVAFVTYFEDGSRKFIFHIDNSAAVMASSPSIPEIEQPKFFHLMGCSLFANDKFYKEIITTMGEFVSKGARVSFDPNIRKELLKNRNLSAVIEPVMAECSVLLPGVEELLLITGETTVEAAVDRIFNKYAAMEIIALKKGKKGCNIYTRNESFNLGVYTVKPVDPTGAGDCFDAGFLCGLLENKPLVECAKLATAAASLCTAAFGPMEGDISIANVRKLMEAEDIIK
ncbi:MAG: sugar kinase [Clostridiaceae bacterium]|nr:sugar kinase [Clostridiaceae bacterium]